MSDVNKRRNYLYVILERLNVLTIIISFIDHAIFRDLYQPQFLYSLCITRQKGGK